MKLFHTLKTEGVDYSKMIIEKALEKEGKVTGSLSEMFEKLKNNRSFCLEHEELLSVAQLLNSASSQTALSLASLGGQKKGGLDPLGWNPIGETFSLELWCGLVWLLWLLWLG